MSGKIVAIALVAGLAVAGGTFYTGPDRSFEEIITASRMGDMTTFANLVNMERIRAKMKMDVRSDWDSKAEGKGGGDRNIGQELVNLLGSALSEGMSRLVNGEDLALEIAKGSDYAIAWQGTGLVVVTLRYADPKKRPLKIILERQGFSKWSAVALESR